MSWAGEAGARHAYLPNSFRFVSKAEAKCFIDQVMAQWIPQGFIWAVQVVRSEDPVNAVWDDRQKEAIGLDVALESAPTTPIEHATSEDEDETPALVNEKSYRSDANSRKRQQRIINREAYRLFEDQSQWYDQEDQALLSETLRDDLRQLLAHGDCCCELSRKIYDGFKTAHDGRAPEGQNYTVTERPGYGGCRYEIDQDIRQLKGVFSGDDDGPRYAITEFLVTKSAKKRGVKLQTLKTKSLAKLVAFAEEMGVEGAGIPLRMMRKPELIHEIIKGAELAGDDLHAFDLGEGVAGGSAMQELIRWLAMPEVHDVYREELKELAALNLEDTGSKPLTGLTNIHRIDMAIESWLEKVSFAALMFEKRFMYLALHRVDESLARVLQTERDNFDRAVLTGSFEEINRLGSSICRTFEMATKAMEEEAAGARRPLARKRAGYDEAVERARSRLAGLRKANHAMDFTNWRGIPKAKFETLKPQKTTSDISTGRAK